MRVEQSATATANALRNIRHQSPSSGAYYDPVSSPLTSTATLWISPLRAFTFPRR